MLGSKHRHTVRGARLLWGGVGLVAALAVAVGVWVSISAAAATVTTDKANYLPHETVTITGAGFSSNASYDVPVIRPDGTIVRGDGTFTTGWDTVVSDGSGSFTYPYELDGVEGLYQVRVYQTPWSGYLNQNSLASTYFWDGKVQHQQFQNGATKALTQGDEEWAKGNINQSNSDLTEGDSVAYRFEFDDVEAGAVIELGITYEFNKSTSYAFDFLTNFHRTEGDANIDLLCSPQSPITTLAEAGCNKTAIAIPDDTTHAFDNALAPQYFTVCGNFVALSSSVESGPTCVTGSCNGTNDSEKRITLRIKVDTDSGATEDIAVAWGGHLSRSVDWGIGLGSGFISGAPFHHN